MTKPLLIVSSKTGNTRVIAHAVADSLPDALLTTAEKLPEDLSGFNPVGLFFWCDRGMAPEDTKAVAPKLAGRKSPALRRWAATRRLNALRNG